MKKASYEKEEKFPSPESPREPAKETSNSESTTQPSEDTISFKLFKIIQVIAEEFCEDKTIFRYGATIKDKEIAYVYFYFLYCYASQQYDFDTKILTDAFEHIIISFYVNYDYTDEMLEEMNNIRGEKFKIFYSIHEEYIVTKDGLDRDPLAYTKSIIAEFPNASFEDAASADIIFANFFCTALEQLKVVKEELDCKANQKEKHPMDSVSNTAQPVKFWNPPLILCVVALIGSLIGNICQSTVSQSLTQEVINQQNAFTQSKEYMEYDFYHNNAALVVEEDPNYYHTYDCPNINEYDFMICNRVAAAYAGFSPCPDCNPPQ